MKKIEFGINDMAQVILTDEGREVREFFLQRFLGNIPGDLKLDKPSTLRVPLWQVMLIFGGSFGKDKGSLFVGDRIQIEVPDDGSCVYIEENSIHDSKACMYRV